MPPSRADNKTCNRFVSLFASNDSNILRLLFDESFACAIAAAGDDDDGRGIGGGAVHTGETLILFVFADRIICLFFR